MEAYLVILWPVSIVVAIILAVIAGYYAYNKFTLPLSDTKYTDPTIRKDYKEPSRARGIVAAIVVGCLVVILCLIVFHLIFSAIEALDEEKAAPENTVLLEMVDAHPLPVDEDVLHKKPDTRDAIEQAVPDISVGGQPVIRPMTVTPKEFLQIYDKKIKDFNTPRLALTDSKEAKAVFSGYIDGVRVFRGEIDPVTGKLYLVRAARPAPDTSRETKDLVSFFTAVTVATTNESPVEIIPLISNMFGESKKFNGVVARDYKGHTITILTEAGEVRLKIAK